MSDARVPRANSDIGRSADAELERLARAEDRAEVHEVDPAELEPFDPADHDDDENTDHLARLSDPEVLARVELIDEAEGGQRYAPRSD